MWDKALNKFFLAFFYIPDWCKTLEICNSIICEDPFSVRYVLGQYKTQQMRDKAVDDCLGALEVASFGLLQIKGVKFFTAFNADENLLYFNEDFSNAVSSCNGMGILNIDLNNTNLGDTNHDEDDPDTIIRLLAGHIKFEKGKTLKK